MRFRLTIPVALMLFGCTLKTKQIQHLNATSGPNDNPNCTWVAGREEITTKFLGLQLSRQITPVSSQLFWCCADPPGNTPLCVKARWSEEPGFDSNSDSGTLASTSAINTTATTAASFMAGATSTLLTQNSAPEPPPAKAKAPEPSTGAMVNAWKTGPSIQEIAARNAAMVEATTVVEENTGPTTVTSNRPFWLSCGGAHKKYSQMATLDLKNSTSCTFTQNGRSTNLYLKLGNHMNCEVSGSKLVCKGKK